MAGVFRWLPRLTSSASTLSRPCIDTVRIDSAFAPLQKAFFCQSTRLRDARKTTDESAESPARPLSAEAQQEKAEESQTKRPWLREGLDRPPPVADTETTVGKHMTKGKLLTTPNRLLKFILPLPTGPLDGKDGNAHIEPLSLFLHPQQPISYVQRLIQAELPPLVDAKGRERPPNVTFWAEDTGSEHQMSDKEKKEREESKHPKPGSHVAAYSGLGHEGAERKDTDKDWVRWGSSTEMGDFIREAARGREFVIRIEDEPKQVAKEVQVSVPSFDDRTYYQRMRLRRLSWQIEQLAEIKRECDMLAHRSARNLAKGGFGILVGWWAVVYYVTFCTDYGWDLVEPITYLASLTAILGGYFWFLFVSRDVSYKAAMNVTVSRHQTSLYETRGFDVRRWERLVEEANGLRSEIRSVAYEYDVDWDEAGDLGSAKVKKVLEKEEKRANNAKEEEEEMEGEEEAEEEHEGKDQEKKEEKK